MKTTLLKGGDKRMAVSLSPYSLTFFDLLTEMSDLGKEYDAYVPMLASYY